jgi:hypothetical protein
MWLDNEGVLGTRSSVCVCVCVCVCVLGCEATHVLEGLPRVQYVALLVHGLLGLAALHAAAPRGSRGRSSRSSGRGMRLRGPRLSPRHGRKANTDWTNGLAARAIVSLSPRRLRSPSPLPPTTARPIPLAPTY